MNILLFGMGGFYQKRKSELRAILQGDKVIGFVDNRAKERRTADGLPVYLPGELKNIAFDGIVLMNGSIIETREQLLGLGVPKLKIFFWEQYEERTALTRMHRFPRLRQVSSKDKRKRLLLISPGLTGIGGAMLAGCYAAKALTVRGYVVTMAASDGRDTVIQDLCEAGVEVWIIPGLRFLRLEYMASWPPFDVALVSVFQNIHLAYECSKRMPTLWWIHEPSVVHHSMYPVTQYCFPELDTPAWMGRLRIAAVSRLARQNFERYYPGQVDAVLPMGEPDTVAASLPSSIHLPVRFAILGAVTENKAQDLFLEAALRMPKILREASEFLVIGAYQESSTVYRRVCRLADRLPQAKVVGVLPPSRLAECLPTMDVVVCASMEETMSMPIIEGMMHGKIGSIIFSVG